MGPLHAGEKEKRTEKKTDAAPFCILSCRLVLAVFNVILSSKLNTEVVKKRDRLLSEHKLTFIMESEPLTNGSHKEEDDLKLTKSVPSIVENGNNENISPENIKNGHEEESVIKVQVNTEQENITTKESTPSKRELRPRESTPRSTPIKEKGPKSGTPKRELKAKKPNVTSTENEHSIGSKTEESLDKTAARTETTSVNSSDEIVKDSEPSKENTDTLQEKSSETIQKYSQESTVVDVSTEENKQTSPKGFFSYLLSPRKAAESIDKVATPASVVKDSQSLAYLYEMNTDIKGRRALKAFSRFPGRNVSVSPSRKRKGEDEIHLQDEKKQCIRTRESGSEKSPGWRFLSSPFERIWSPNRRFETTVPSSTPLKSINDDDSMAVNFNENSKQSLESSTQIAMEGTTKPKERSKCSIM